jgi:hypothetical protein
MAVLILKRLPNDPPAVADMLVARDRIKQRLMANSDYRALTALDNAIIELRKAVDLGVREAPPSGNPSPTGIEDMSQADATYVLLKQAIGKPTPTSDLVDILASNGVVIGGKDPTINLSSILSKDGRFKSERVNGRPCWWIRKEETAAAKAAESTG